MKTGINSSSSKTYLGQDPSSRGELSEITTGFIQLSQCQKRRSADIETSVDEFSDGKLEIVVLRKHKEVQTKIKCSTVRIKRLTNQKQFVEGTRNL